MSTLGAIVDLSVDYDAAVDLVIDALGKEGFGVLTRINVHDALREKIGVEFRRYVILGACKPALAHKALSAEPSVGLLLPCNICVEETDSGARAYLINANVLLAAGGIDENDAIKELGVDATERLNRVASALREI